jgi:hypothetical protein
MLTCGCGCRKMLLMRVLKSVSSMDQSAKVLANGREQP